MKLAYIVSAYKLPEQLTRLIHRLNTETASFFIHIDKRTDDRLYRQMINGLHELPNVHWLKRNTCDWGGFGHVTATLKGMNELFKSKTDFDYAILLTGQDYPIKSNAYIDRFFQAHRGQLFLEYFPLPHAEWQNCGMDRIAAWHWRGLNKRLRLAPGRLFPIQRKFPKGFTPFGGSSYWCFSRECMEYISTCTRSNHAYVNFFRYVDVPDEIFFQTIVLNSPFARMAVNDNLRYIEWNDLNSASPAVLRKADLEKLTASPRLFARKFDSTVDAEVLDLIDQKILFRTSLNGTEG